MPQPQPWILLGRFSGDGNAAVANQAGGDTAEFCDFKSRKYHMYCGGAGEICGARNALSGDALNFLRMLWGG